MEPGEVEARLRAAGCVFAAEEAALLTEAANGGDLLDLVRRRCAGEPLEHLLGFVEFCGRRYRVSPGVFVPRQRSTLLVETAAGLGGALVLDLCCGCGALGLAIASRLDAELFAADLDPVAVADARSNGASHAYVGDLFEPLPTSRRGRVDLLVANTPYVPTAAIAQMPPEARDHEPSNALDGGPDGTDLQRRVLSEAAGWLAPSGTLLTETSSSQAPRLQELASALGWSTEIVTDPGRGATVMTATPGG